MFRFIYLYVNCSIFIQIALQYVPKGTINNTSYVNCSIFIQIALQYVPKGTINNTSALAQMMAWQQAIIWTNDGLVYWCIYASGGLCEISRTLLAISRIQLIENMNYVCLVKGLTPNKPSSSFSFKMSVKSDCKFDHKFQWKLTFKFCVIGLHQ